MKIHSNKLTALVFSQNRLGNITNDFLTGSVSSASARLQLLPALQSAQKLGIEVNLFSLHSSKPADLNLLKPNQICLIGKMSASNLETANGMTMANLAAANRLKRMGSKIILQYCDHLVANHGETMHNFYKDIFKISDYIIYPSKTICELNKLFARPDCKIKIINDPWQLTKWHPTRPLTNNGICRIIWFGSNKNIKYLLNVIPNMMEKSYLNKQFELTILGTDFAHHAAKKTLASNPLLGKNWTIRLVTWNYNNQPLQLESEIARAHISLIPSNPKDPTKAGVSHNRLVDSLRGGCVSIASPMESYKDLHEIALLGNNMSNLLNDAIENYPQYCNRLTTLREKKLSEFSPEINNNNWQRFWENILLGA